MSFNPAALNERTLKQFVDRLAKLRQSQSVPNADQWPPKRSHLQEEIAQILGFTSWHQAIHAVRPADGNQNTKPKATKPGELYPNEPAQWNARELDALLIWAASKNASDIIITSNEKIYMDALGKIHKVSQREITQQEVRDIIEAMTGKTFSPSDMKSIDFAHIANGDQTHRFRVNATPFTTGAEGATQISLSFRVLSGKPPSTASLGLTQELKKATQVKNGLILVTGSTGSGKTTLLSALVQELLSENSNKKLLTYEQPIEYVYDEIGAGNVLHQHDLSIIPMTFDEGIRNSLARRPTDILVGETRDASTIEEMITAALIGHRVWASTNATGVADTVRRLIAVFPKEEIRSRAVDVLSAVRVIISVRLLPKTDGTRIAIFEYLIMNDDFVDTLLDAGLENLSAVINHKISQDKTNFLSDATRKYQAGLISKKELDLCAATDKYR